MIWEPFKVGEAEYDLSHLNPFTMSITTNVPGPAVVTRQVRVTFGCHSFTKEWEDGDPEELRYDDGGHIRCFCPARHALSVNLPDLIREAAKGKVHFNNKRSPYLTVHNVPEANGPYLIYFDAIRAKGAGLHAVIDIRSAHCKPGFTPTTPQIAFATVIGLTAAGKPVNRPKK